MVIPYTESFLKIHADVPPDEVLKEHSIFFQQLFGKTPRLNKSTIASVHAELFPKSKATTLTSIIKVAFDAMVDQIKKVKTGEKWEEWKKSIYIASCNRVGAKPVWMQAEQLVSVAASSHLPQAPPVLEPPDVGGCSSKDESHKRSSPCAEQAVILQVDHTVFTCTVRCGASHQEHKPLACLCTQRAETDMVLFNSG